MPDKTFLNTSDDEYDRVLKAKTDAEFNAKLDSHYGSTEVVTASPIDDSSGPLSVLEKNAYNYQSIAYPIDVETNDRFKYYIRFRIRINKKSQYKEKFLYKDFIPPEDPGASTNVEKEPIRKFFKRQTVRTGQSISLYMPDTLNWGLQNSWEDMNITEAMGTTGYAISVASTAGTAVKDTLKGGTSVMSKEEYLKQLASEAKTESSAQGLLGEGVGKILAGQSGERLGLAKAGFALNPSIEVLYKQPTMREFQFEFVFAPRNAKDSNAALAIIRLFRFHSSPEMSGGPDLGRFFIPPSEFDIEFMGRNGELWQLGKILPSCILTGVTTNYAQSGQFATFEDGTPTNIQLQLNFKETEFITKELVDKGY